MPQKAWAVGEEVLAADFNNYVQNQVVAVFTTVAERDSQWAAPPAGAVCVTVDTGTFWQRIGGAWYTPLARLNSGGRPTDMGFVGTAETAGIVTLAVTVPAGRKIRLVANVAGANCSTVNDRAYLRIKEGAVLLTQLNLNFNANFQSNGGTFSVTASPGAGAHTYTLVAAGGSGGNFNIQCTANNPATLEIFDVGTV